MRTETETRWMVLGADGQHVSLGRAEPSDAEIATPNDAPAAQGLSGWPARMQGNYYSWGCMTFKQIKRSGNMLDTEEKVARTAFLLARRCATCWRP